MQPLLGQQSSFRYMLRVAVFCSLCHVGFGIVTRPSSPNSSDSAIVSSVTNVSRFGDKIRMMVDTATRKSTANGTLRKQTPELEQKLEKLEFAMIEKLSLSDKLHHDIADLHHRGADRLKALDEELKELHKEFEIKEKAAHEILMKRDGGNAFASFIMHEFHERDVRISDEAHSIINMRDETMALEDNLGIVSTQAKNELGFVHGYLGMMMEEMEKKISALEGKEVETDEASELEAMVMNMEMSNAMLDEEANRLLEEMEHMEADQVYNIKFKSDLVVEMKEVITRLLLKDPHYGRVWVPTGRVAVKARS